MTARIVLLSGRVDPDGQYLVRVSEDLADVGTVIGTITYGPLQAGPPPEFATVVIDPAAKKTRARRGWRRRVHQAHRLVTGGPNNTRFCTGLLRSPEAAALISDADLVVAIESNAIEAAWRLVRRRSGLRATNGPIAARWMAVQIAASTSKV